MYGINKRTLFAVNVGVWLAALTSAAAVAVAATRPASLPASPSGLDLQTSIECAPEAQALSVTQPTVFMPDDTIVALRPTPGEL